MQNKNSFNGRFTLVKSGFTLIEVLVVVLIIGILTSIALPQYQRSVVKARNANFKQDIMSVSNAQDVYLETFNTCADSFDALDVSIPLAVETEDPCTIGHNGSDAMRGNGDYYIVLNNVGNTCSITGAWKKGDYKCTGFSYIVNSPSLEESNHTLMCVEKGDATKRGVFCSKLEHASFVTYAGYWDWYSL